MLEMENKYGIQGVPASFAGIRMLSNVPNLIKVIQN